MTLLRLKPHRKALALVTVAALGLTVLSTQFSPPAIAQAAATAGHGDAAAHWRQAEPTGRLIVKYRSASQPWQSPRGSTFKSRSTLRSDHRLYLERDLSNTKELVRAAQTDNIDTLRAHARELGNQHDVEYASIEYRRHPMLQPNDPLYQGSQSTGNQSYLYDGDYSLQAPGAWDITTGSSQSVIAIVDTGILPNHPDIKSRSVVGLGYDFVSADNPADFTSANDGDGRDSDPLDPGDPCNGSGSSWHGTAVASAAAGNSNNGEGLTGIDWNARLLHARALGICGGTDADIIDAIRWSAGLQVAGIPDNPNPANVVNVSLGGPTECTRAWQDVIDELAEQNIVIVIAAGNDPIPVNALRSSPANCANVITVGSSTPGGGVDSGFSNYGLKVTISTAGRDILVASNRGFNSADIDGDYYRGETGTSFSAALVSGAISLMHSLNPDLGPAGVRALLQESATAFAPGSSCDLYYCGGGILNLSRALEFLRSGNFDPERNVAIEQVQNESTFISLQTETSAALFGYKDVRYFSVFVPDGGLLQAQSSSNEDLFGYLLNSDLSVIALDDDSGDSTNFRVAALVDPGTYHIAVEREAHRTSDGELPFTLTTSLSNDAPAAFSFAPVTNAVANGVIQSDTVMIQGLEGESVLTVSDGFYSLNGSELMNTPATVRNGDTFYVATQSPGNPGSSTTATVTVGAYSTSFAVTTTQDSFTFQSGSSNRSSSGCSVMGNTRFDPLFALLLLTGLFMQRRRSR